MEYTVRWTTQVDAESPQEAAKLAAAMQRDPSTLAIVFEVVAGEYSDDPNVQYKTIEVPWPETPVDMSLRENLLHGQRQALVQARMIDGDSPEPTTAGTQYRGWASLMGQAAAALEQSFNEWLQRRRKERT
jgi:hypothetical protein